MYCNCHNTPSCPQDCSCKKTTTTTTCIPVYSPPCDNACDEIQLTDCVIYTGPNIECYGISNGDNITDVLVTIFNKLNIQNCTTTTTAAPTTTTTTIPPTTTTTTIPTTTTTTTPPTTTTTTSIPTTTTSTTAPVPIDLCFLINSVDACSAPTYLTIEPSITLINGKHYYEFTYEGVDYKISWSSATNRWELVAVSLGNSLVAYLNTNTPFPIGDLINSWFVFETSIITTRVSCPQPICLSIDEGLTITLYSSYNTADTVQAPFINRPYYKYCGDDEYNVRWNAFTNRYELFIGSLLVAYLVSTNPVGTWVTIYPGLGIVTSVYGECFID
jgi:hypothetical protein